MDDLSRKFKQGTDEWRLARVGFVTGSRVHDVVATTKSGGYTAERSKYLWDKINERATGEPRDSRFCSYDMKWGTDTEPEARDAYTLFTEREVEEVGFLHHPTIEWAGSSPDGLLIEGEGLLEIKCPTSPTHADIYRHETIPAEYVNQMQFGMAVSGAQWADFVSYDPRFKPHRRLKIIRVKRDNPRIAKLEQEVRAFLAEVEKEAAYWL